MTLKENLTYNNLTSNKLEQIADEFAIGFAHWVDKLQEKLPYLGIYEFQMQFGSKTFKELLEIYKKEKEL